MAFSRDGLSRIGGSGDANAVWVYSSTESPATVAGSGYFNNASAELTVGDVVLIVDTDAPAVTVSFVISNSAGVVDCASGTALGNV